MPNYLLIIKINIIEHVVLNSKILRIVIIVKHSYDLLIFLIYFILL